MGSLYKVQVTSEMPETRGAIFISNCMDPNWNSLISSLGASEAEDIPLMIEAIPMNAECIVLIITKVEDPEELDTRFAKFAPSVHESEDSADDDSLEADLIHTGEEVLDLFKKKMVIFCVIFIKIRFKIFLFDKNEIISSITIFKFHYFLYIS